MRLLFAIPILSFCALFWAVLAAAKHLRARREQSRKPLPQKPMMEIFESGEFRTPRSLRLVQNLVQEVAQPRTQPQHATLDDRDASSTRDDGPKYQPREQADLPQPLILKPAIPAGPQTVFVERRKGPQSVRPTGIERRADWALYNKDLGDLTDPYTQPLRSAAATGTSSLNRS